MTEASPTGQNPVGAETIVPFTRGEGIYVASLFVAAYGRYDRVAMKAIQDSFRTFGVPAPIPERDRLRIAAQGILSYFSHIPVEPNKPSIDYAKADPTPMGRVRTALASDGDLARLFFGVQTFDRKQERHGQLGLIALQLRRAVITQQEQDAAIATKAAAAAAKPAIPPTELPEDPQ